MSSGHNLSSMAVSPYRIHDARAGTAALLPQLSPLSSSSWPNITRSRTWVGVLYGWTTMYGIHVLPLPAERSLYAILARASLPTLLSTSRLSLLLLPSTC